MHDSSMMKGLIRTAETAARQAGGSRVSGLRVRVGSLSGISPDHLRGHFEEAAAGTLLEGALLTVEEGPAGVAALDDPSAQGVLLIGVDVEDD